MHAQSAQRCLLPVQTGDLMLTHLCAPNCCHGRMPAVLTPTALCNFPTLAALGMLSLLENRRHRHLIMAEHGNYFCSSPAAGKEHPLVTASWEWVTAAGAQRCHTLPCSIQQQLLLPAVCHISWPQQAVHVAQEEALPAAG